MSYVNDHFIVWHGRKQKVIKLQRILKINCTSDEFLFCDRNQKTKKNDLYENMY